MPNGPMIFVPVRDPEGGRPWKRFDYNSYDDTVCGWCSVRVPRGSPVLFRRVGGFLHPACWAEKFGRTAALADPAIPRNEFPPERRVTKRGSRFPDPLPDVPSPVSDEELNELFKDT